MNTNAIAAARQAHSTRCRQRVLAALEQAAHLGDEITVSAIARLALLTELIRKSSQFNGHVTASCITVS
ncbi:hypothetical protein, partial [Rhodococcus sp. T7]|uniref:hypothetical protein n=1 Tax=Rhodococcus sp. T7 TaxID=627444 RepID=UPI003FA7900E